MANRRKRSRLVLTVLAAAVIGGALTFAFRAQPMLVDIGAVEVRPMMSTIDEVGRTQVRNPYVVSTPVAGRLQRVEVRPGDVVERGRTVVAHMLPTNPAALDVRTREQARAAVTAAEAALRVAQADFNAASANADLSASELERTRRLAALDIVSDAALEHAEQSARVAEANVDTAKAAIAIREADLANAHAQLIGFDDTGLANALGGVSPDAFPLYAPADGRILQVIQQSETTLPAGAPIMEIGNIENDLEVVVDLLSTDAVAIRPGDEVLIEDWGGAGVLNGKVLRVDPFGVTRFSALGVEEQRVPTVISFTSPPEARQGLGHGYRVEARIITWQDDSALVVPSAALFRDGADWQVFVIVEGIATRQTVGVGHNNGIEAEVLDGLKSGDQVVLYPGSGLTSGTAVALRSIQ